MSTMARRAWRNGACPVGAACTRMSAKAVGRMPDPGTSARRSRRGYYYQDVCALQRCIDMLDGLWKTVTLEGDEDIILVRTRPAGRKYCQVKTVEGPRQLWTAALLCRPEVVAQPATSILGRLFTSRPVPRDAALELILNEEVDAKLRPLCTSPAASPGGHDRHSS